MIDIDTLIAAMVTGLFVGLGSTVGAYIANKHLLKNLERFEKAVSEAIELRKEPRVSNKHLGHPRKYPRREE